MSMENLINTGKSRISSIQSDEAKAYISSASETLKYAGHYMLEVTNGVHAGSAHIQKSGSIVVGSAASCDLVLFASHVAPEHFEIILPAGLMSRLQVKPIGDSVVLEDGSVVEVGQVADLESQEVISFGDTEIAVSRIADPKSFIKPGIRILAFICLLAMIPIVYGIAANFLGTVAEAGSRIASTMHSGIERTSSTILGSIPTSENQSHDRAYAWSVKVKLEDLGLNHKLRADTTNEGSIRVYGSISDKELPRWTNFLQWYDTKTSFPPLIRDVSRTDVDTNLPKIKSVWIDDKPSVFFKDGTVGNIGSSIKGGWKIVDITNSAVMIERDGSVVSLTY